MWVSVNIRVILWLGSLTSTLFLSNLADLSPADGSAKTKQRPCSRFSEPQPQSISLISLLQPSCTSNPITLHTSVMSSNVGLTTPRGSGTSGYVQRNLSHFKPRDNFAPYPQDYDSLKHRQRKPDKDILNHDRLREIEVKVYDLRDKLEDEG